MIHFQRMAAISSGTPPRFNAVEINSAFYRSHKPATYARWAESTPGDFQFSVKLPKEITHMRKLLEIEQPLAAFLHEISHLGGKLGPVLIQQPPSAAFDRSVVESFLSLLRSKFAGAVVWEPRDESWFTADAEKLLVDFQVTRVAADPEPVPGASKPAGFGRQVYYRLHGAPRVYYSEYTAEQISAYAEELKSHANRGAEVWCIFDNTALGAATKNSLELITAMNDRMAVRTCHSKADYAMTAFTTSPLHVGQPKISPSVPVRQTLVIDAHKMQDRGVQIVHIDGARDDRFAEVVGFAVDHAPFDASAGQPD